MASTSHATHLLIIGTLLLVASGCKQPDERLEPPFEETSTRVIQSQVEEALELLRSVQGEIQSNPEQVEENLDGAVRDMERLSKYYLPLLEARERTYNAHRFLYYRETQR
ncbi:MAG: hypothetical protein ACYS5W_24425, partial [Planctomycetota bacterium]